MKTILHILAALALLATAFAAAPNVAITVEPTEDNLVFYGAMGALTEAADPTGRLYLKVNITNNSGADLTLTGFRVSLTGTDVTYVRDVLCPAGETTSDELKDKRFGGASTFNEVITIPHPAPALLTIRLYFGSNPTPAQVQRILVPYTPAVPGGEYQFFADEGDLGPEEYFSAGTAHGAHGNQGWGSDWKVYRVASLGNTTTLRDGGVDSVNADHLGWGIPIRAMADGTVLRTSTGWINNPTAGTRAFQQMAEFDGEAISDVKVTRLSETRAVSLQLLPSGQVQLSVWDTTGAKLPITRLGSSPLVPGETVAAMAIDALDATHVVGALRVSGSNNLRVVLWGISADGLTVTRTDDATTGNVLDVSIAKMSTTRFAIGSRAEPGILWTTVWEVDGSELDYLAGETGEAITAVHSSGLTSTRLATSSRTNGGLLKVVVWELTGEPGAYVLDRRGEQTGESISRLAATWNDGDKWVTATRMIAGGLLRLTRWYTSADGESVFSELGTTTNQVIQDTALAIAPGTGDNTGAIHATTASIIAGGLFKINGWGNKPSELPDSYDYSAQNTGPAVTHVSLDELGTTNYLVAARAPGGTLKMMTWHWADGGGNSVIMLHGDCRVLYAHLLEDSVDTTVLYPGATVKAGQVLGRMGNSGASGGPHTHIDSARIFPITSIPDMIAREALDTLPLIGSRPMPFSGARAMRLSLISPGGEGNGANDFATLDGHGMYDVALGIRPRLSTRYIDLTSTLNLRTGLKDPQPGSPQTGGPKRTVAEMLAVAPSFMRLYIRGGSYDEAVTLATPMVVRRYDFHTSGGPVVIGK